MLEVYNHELYFENLCPLKNTQPNGLFKEKIIETYKTLDNYHKIISELVNSPINYHWIITTLNYKNELKTIGLKDNDTSITLNLYPILVIDIAEHAYFIKYHNHKEHYVSNLFSIINYDIVNERIKKIKIF